MSQLVEYSIIHIILYLENIACIDKGKSIKSRLKIVERLSHISLGREHYRLQAIVSLGHLEYRSGQT